MDWVRAAGHGDSVRGCCWVPSGIRVEGKRRMSGKETLIEC
jgi:hypothetical protein